VSYTTTAVVSNISRLAAMRGRDGMSVYVSSVECPWQYVSQGGGFTVDHITVEDTADGGTTRWMRVLSYQSPVWTTGVLFHYVDGTNGDDENQGIYSTPQMAPAALKTWAEWIRRVGYVWHIFADQTVTCGATWPTDTLPLTIDFHLPTAGVCPIVTFNPPAYTQFSAGSLTAVIVRDNATNTPYDVADGVVVTTGDVQHRMRITAGPRAGSIAWVAKSTGAGQRRTSEWVVYAGGIVNPVVPQIGDQYVIEGAPSAIVLDHVIVQEGASTPFAVGSPTLIFNAVYFKPPQADGTPMLRNGGCDLVFNTCQFIQGEWQMWTNLQAGDNETGFTYFANCCSGGPVTGGVANIHVFQGEWTENFIDAGLYFGNLEAIGGAGLGIDFNVLCQGAFAQPAATQGGVLEIGQMGVMDWAGSTGGIICDDSIIGITTGRDSGLPGWIWGTTASAGAWGVDVRDSSTMRYKSDATLTITGSGGDARLGGSVMARAWDDVAGAYTANILLSWANLRGGSLKDNAHNLVHDAHLFENSGDAQP
jgi:hypothetical protein